MTYEMLEGGRIPIKAWMRGVPVDDKAVKQLQETASSEVVGPHLAVMPDVHWGMGSTVGSVVPTRRAIIPACVGVDIGCGMTAVRTSLSSSALGDNAQHIFEAFEKAIPHGRTDNGGPNDRGAWGNVPPLVAQAWKELQPGFEVVASRLRSSDERATRQLGTLGTGNHFVEVCLDETDQVWIMLHSGSRGIGNQIAGRYIAIAKRTAENSGTVLPNSDLAWLEEGTAEFDHYFAALEWAQCYARVNRETMMAYALAALVQSAGTFNVGGGKGDWAVNCHHNYVSRESHFGEDLYITRKGAVSAKRGQLGIIPGSMGTKSYIVRGLGNVDSFHSCSHGAGRVMSRGEAKRKLTLDDHARDTAGVACRKDKDVLDESPRAYKNVDAVIEAQKDLVEIVHTLKGVVCVKG